MKEMSETPTPSLPTLPPSVLVSHSSDSISAQMVHPLENYSSSAGKHGLVITHPGNIDYNNYNPLFSI